jgi:exodeoxyribonuclease V alpha subunit
MILCGLRRGPGSVKWWNEEMRQSLISARLIEPDNRLPIGAPVLVTKNENQVGRNPSDSLNNGDLGAVVEGADGPEVIFAGEPTARRRRTTEINQFDLGWSLTIHKSQGSEYKKVIVSLPMKNSSFVSKELLYTAVTRAKHEVTVVGSIESISKIIANEASRVGGLQARLEAKLA